MKSEKTLKIGASVRVVGFRVPSKPNPSDGVQNEKHELDYVETFTGKTGVVKLIDTDALHPVTVFFGENHLPRCFRFSVHELQECGAGV